jgi:hypothetical protein
MVPLIVSTIITCSDAVGIINRIVSSIGLTNQQKIEVIAEFRKLIPTCPVTIKKDEPIKK